MNRLQYILDLLPTNPIDIALYLKSRNITDLKRSYNNCPIANYIKKETEEENCSVDISRILLRGIEQIKPPKHIVDFIRAFDSNNLDEIFTQE